MTIYTNILGKYVHINLLFVVPKSAGFATLPSLHPILHLQRTSVHHFVKNKEKRGEKKTVKKDHAK